MASRDVMSRVWALAESVATEMGLELVGLERGGGPRRQILRLFIDKPEGVTLLDCERVSRELGRRLEEESAVEFSYILEVSSPGLERPLRREADFDRFAGQRIQLRLHQRDEESGKRKFSGILRGMKDDMIVIDITESGETRSFPLSAVAKANLEVDWDAVLREKRATR